MTPGRDPAPSVLAAPRQACVHTSSPAHRSVASAIASAGATGESMPVKDSLIAATALVHDLIVVTRNHVEFERAGVGIVDPFG